jgi:hypothetical protein
MDEHGLTCPKDEEMVAKTLRDLGLAGPSPDAKIRYESARASTMLRDFEEYFRR